MKKLNLVSTTFWFHDLATLLNIPGSDGEKKKVDQCLAQRGVAKSKKLSAQWYQFSIAA